MFLNGKIPMYWCNFAYCRSLTHSLAVWVLCAVCARLNDSHSQFNVFLFLVHSVHIFTLWVLAHIENVYVCECGNSSDGDRSIVEITMGMNINLSYFHSLLRCRFCVCTRMTWYFVYLLQVSFVYFYVYVTTSNVCNVHFSSLTGTRFISMLCNASNECVYFCRHRSCIWGIWITFLID